MRYYRNYGLTFVVEADNEEQAEELLDEIALRELGRDIVKNCWAGDVEVID